MLNIVSYLRAIMISGVLLAVPTGTARSQTAGPPSAARRFPYVGACLSCEPRLEKMPGRRYLDFQGRPVDPVRFFAANGFNAVRVEVTNGQSDKTPPIDNRDADHREANYQLDFGGRDAQVAMAGRARALGEHVVLTLQFGQDKPIDSNWHEFIPDAWLGLTYRQMLDKIDTGTRQMLRPFLHAKIQPDIIICENEADSGMLFQTVGRDGKMTLRDDSKADPFSDDATGMYTNWPKCAGYFKREILSAKDELRKEGFDPAQTRFAVHTTTNPYRARSTFDRIFRGKLDAESIYYEDGKPRGVVTAVPEGLRRIHLRDLVDIMGFSCYPIMPDDGSPAAIADSLQQVTGDLAYFNTVIPSFGRYTRGPFRGQSKKQVLVVEFSVATDEHTGFDVAAQQRFVTEFFHRLSAYPWTLGALWWEPTYANNNWNHHEGALYRNGAWDAKRQDTPDMTPVATIKTWGTFAAPRNPPHLGSKRPTPALPKGKGASIESSLLLLLPSPLGRGWGWVPTQQKARTYAFIDPVGSRANSSHRRAPVPRQPVQL